jgi:hypothetical protein
LGRVAELRRERRQRHQVRLSVRQAKFPGGIGIIGDRRDPSGSGVSFLNFLQLLDADFDR